MQANSIYEIIEESIDEHRFSSKAIESERLNLVEALYAKCPRVMPSLAKRTAPFIYAPLLHSSANVRLKAMQVVKMAMPDLVAANREICVRLTDDMRPILTEMQKLLANNEIHVMRIWALFCEMLGSKLHRGKLINDILPIVEKGFKHADPNVKTEAYQSWISLIDNFGLDLGEHSLPVTMANFLACFRCFK